MKASDIMTSPVITVAPDTSVQEIARLLFERRISAVPVLEGGRLVGMVSEGDLLHRREIGTERREKSGSWWLRLFGPDRSPEDYIKSHARRARDIMTREVVTVGPQASLAEIASLLESRRIKRVPVVDREQVIGIVSRSNLVQALAVQKAAEPATAQDDDDAIRGRLAAELERQPWWRRQVSNVIVADGVVHYWGTYEEDGEREAARVAAENIPGVRGVEDHRLRLRDLPASV